MASDCDTLTENLDAAPAEDLLGAIGVALVRHQYGYSDEQMETAAAQSCADAGCEPFDASYFGAEFAGSTAYDCTNENGDSHHPIRDAIAEASDLANVAVEAVEALGWRPPAREITTAAEADALPIGTILLHTDCPDSGPCIWTRACAPSEVEDEIDGGTFDHIHWTVWADEETRYDSEDLEGHADSGGPLLAVYVPTEVTV